MRLELREVERTPSLVHFEATLPIAEAGLCLNYRTRTGAVAAIDGITVGAFDREHTDIEIPPAPYARMLRMQVEREGLPTNGLPPGNGIRWRIMVARSRPQPQRYCVVRPSAAPAARVRDDGDGLVLWGHSHLDVAWLWTYDQAARKAVRTFANAASLLEGDPTFTFMQSQPQLYAFVEREDAELFARVRHLVRAGRFDPDVAALWVEPDCNVPSGESLLRQMLFAHRFCVEHFGIEPAIAWLPDSFGFARTLPTLLAHAGIAYFATTKLQWNDTTRFPYPQFRWRGPDGSEVIGALIDSYDGGPDPRRNAIAKTRGEPLVVGYGDGGGGPTAQQLRDGDRVGTWQRPRAWFDALRARAGELPPWDDELYLEYHRGAYTTHHDVKANNAALERSLARAEERVAWCIAVHAPGEVVARLRGSLDAVWTIVLRNQFHDVLPGTSIRAVYEDVAREYDAARELIENVIASTRAILPRAPRHEASVGHVRPILEDDEYVFDNGLVRARVGANGAIAGLLARGGTNVAAHANLLAAYRDRPRHWEAWNIDAGYEKGRVRVLPQGADRVDDGLDVRFSIGRSRATMRISIEESQPFLRVELAVDWRERRTLLRLENWLTIDSDYVSYGAPHGIVERSALKKTPQERAKFEVPGQRYAIARGEATGLAIFALDTYGWNARALSKGGLHVGHSLLRSTSWPDPLADRGMAHIAMAYMPFATATNGEVERAWEAFAHESEVRLFRTDDDGVVVVACKPAQDGYGVIVRIRECNGNPHTVRIRCGARMRSASPVDALERPQEGDVAIHGEELVTPIAAFGLRSFRVVF